MKRIGREQHTLQAQFADQHLRGRDLVGCSRNLAMGEGQRSICGEGTQHVSGGLIVQVVETVPQGLPIQRNRAHALPNSRFVQATSVATEDSLEIGWVERQDEIAQGVESWSAAEAGTEGLVQALTMQADERDDALIRGRARQDSQDGEKKHVRQPVAFALTPTWVLDLFERSQQSSEGEHSALPGECRLSLTLNGTPDHTQ
jgi:hypothetical protein